MPLVSSPTESLQQTVSGPIWKSTPGTSLVLGLFFVTFFIPLTGEIAGMSLYPLRALVLILFIPFLISLLLGRAGRWTWVDGLMALYAIWVCFTIVYHHGLARLPYGAILGIEAFGGYAIARVIIRSPADYRRFFFFYLLTLLGMLLPAFKEFTIPEPGAIIRWGFARVQLNFPHEISYGLFCSMAIAGSYYLYRDRLTAWGPRVGLVFVTTAMSLSSAPLLAMVLQFIMIVWDKLTKGRWKLFLILVLCLYVLLQMFTRRGAVIFLINKVTLSPATGYMRVYIWQYGKANVLDNPLFGIGLNDWARPSWMASSVDNFWLLTAMRHGLPGVAFILAAFAVHVWLITRARDLDPERQTIRTAYLVTLAGLMFILTTVTVWNEVLIFVMFYLGAGAFLYTSAPDPAGDAAPQQADAADPGPRKSLPLTRFPRPALATGPAPRETARRETFHRSLPPKATRT